jgi:CBS domain-containing protein
MKVSDLMTKDVVSTTPETSLRDAASLLVEHRISGLPVVSTAGEVVGVLSEADILVKADGGRSRHRLLGWLLEPDLGVEDKIRAETVGEAMSAPPVTITAQRSVHEAAHLMVRENVNRLPVLDHDRLAGILTRADVVRAFARSDDEITAEIETEILRRTFWLDPGQVTVTVVDGHVRIAGEVETGADADVLPRLIERVPGVLSVDADLRARTAVTH